MLGEQNGVPPLSHTYILYDYIYDGTNKTKQKEITLASIHPWQRHTHK